MLLAESDGTNLVVFGKSIAGTSSLSGYKTSLNDLKKMRKEGELILARRIGSYSGYQLFKPLAVFEKNIIRPPSAFASDKFKAD